ncbi:hypothetical protein [Hymenobacter sp. B81]|uniref:hypothetical protein n=1 Tax=Hymenobacter sp. B81 TaxID=3344878 RepID=UPI0037DC94CA
MLASAKLAFAQSAPELVAACIEQLRRHPQPPYNRPAEASGRTAQQIREEHGDDFLQVLGPAHAQALITGRRPTGTGAAAGAEPLRVILAQWAQDKGIQLSPGMSYKSFGFLAARKIHQQGTALYRLQTPSAIFSDVLTPQRLATLKSRIAAGEMVAIASELRHALTA